MCGRVKQPSTGLKTEKCFWNIDRNIPLLNNSDSSHFSSSFRYRLNGNTGDADDRIIANPDGALAIITNKKSGPNRVIWSLQEAALAFEVSSPCTGEVNSRQRKRILSGWSL
jgi:hypothetical protein